MSALDQAFIKAYAKDQPAAKAAAVPAASRGSVREPLPAPAAARARAGAIEQLYQGGSLYRVETPGVAIAAGARAVPQPHVKLLPPNSPRRGVQRSLLRLLANQPAELPAVEADAPPPRVARKVIIRHISHAAAPAPLGLRRVAAPIVPPEEIVPQLQETGELPPETIADEPPAAPQPMVAPPSVAPIAAPQTAPLNEARPLPQYVIEPPLAIHGQWELAESAAGMVLLAEPAEFAASPDGLVAVQLDALHLPEPPPAPAISAPVTEVEVKEEVATRFAGKALDDLDESEPHFRIDESHIRSYHRPHAKFVPAPPAVEPEPIEEPEVTAEIVALEEAEPVAELPLEIQPLQIEELTLAEASSDLELSETAAIEQAAVAETKPAAPAKSALPLWEVDRFHWPKTCEKLMSAEGSYFQHAGEKLVAAVRDGLRVLAITGTRRGEGRTTLAMCLARVAAQAGVQTAIMDADFARPQLASKIGLEIAYGWQDAALGNIPLSEAAVKSLADNVTALPLETSAAGARLSLADPRVTATIRAAAATFELLILDLGPVGPGEEIAFPEGERCPLDAAIVVRDLRFATLAESETIGHALSDAGIEAVGIAENFVMEEELPETSV